MRDKAAPSGATSAMTPRMIADEADRRAEDFAELMEVDVEAFKSDVADAEAYLTKFGDKVPARLVAQLKALKSRLG